MARRTVDQLEDSAMSEIAKKRAQLIARLFPEGFPSIWCPPLTHYTEDGKIDFERMNQHLDFLSPHINSFLMPGSTGDGWELTFDEFKEIVDFALSLCKSRKNIRVLIGLLRLEIDGMKTCLNYVVTHFKEDNVKVKADDYEVSGFKGFVICPPKGKDLSEERMKGEMEGIIGLGYPMVLYQLPQVTENEMSPDLAHYFAQRYHYCFMMKDSSGADRVALADKDYGGLILVRGAEENYSRMLKKSGGRYDGFLLSTGNSFPEELSTIIQCVEEGSQFDADALSERLSKAVNEVFRLASSLPVGNAFTNSNKLIDHIKAYGSRWRETKPPRLHSGHFLPKEMLEKVEEILKKHNLYPSKGYLD